MTLPAIPQPSALLAPADVERLRDVLVAWSADATEDAALEALARAQALEKYLSRIDQEGPMLTAERWLERRIGELLPEPIVGSHHSVTTEGARRLDKQVRVEFRLIAQYWSHIEPKLPKTRREALAIANRAKYGERALGDKIIEGNISEGIPEIPDASVHAIITDPPYARTNIPLLGDLSKLAERVLIPGGYCVVLTGHIDLDEQIRQLGSSLSYWWTCALVMGDVTARIFNRRLFVAWKPVLVFRKPPCDPPTTWWRDVIEAGPPSGRERHKWEQGEESMAKLVEMFTLPGETVFDPFVGSGTTLIAAKRLGRHVVGADNDPAALEATNHRLQELRA